MRHSLLLTACCMVMASSVVGAQQRDSDLVTIHGIVVDSSSHPIPGVLVSLLSAGMFTQSDSRGKFALADVERRMDTLQFRRLGFAPRDFRLALAEWARGNVDLGTVALQPGPSPRLGLTVRVRDTIQNRPVGGVQVLVNDSVVGLTDTAGVFAAANLPVDWGRNLALARRVGYAPIFRLFWIGELHETRTLEDFMRPQPVTLPAVVAEGNRIRIIYDRRLQAFWQRRKAGWGRFLSREEIEQRRPVHLSDLLRTMPGVVVERTGATTSIELIGGGTRCTPAIWIDKMPQDTTDLDTMIFPGHVEAIEVYLGGETPVEFHRPDECGAILIWSR